MSRFGRLRWLAVILADYIPCSLQGPAVFLGTGELAGDSVDLEQQAPLFFDACFYNSGRRRRNSKCFLDMVITFSISGVLVIQPPVPQMKNTVEAVEDFFIMCNGEDRGLLLDGNLSQ